MPPKRLRVPIRCRALRAADWPVVVELFGSNGACGGCWCMWWRRPTGGRLWEEKKGRPNRDALRRLIKGDRVHGVLAFAEDAPVGWCCLGPREDFPRLERTQALATDWDERTWSVVCFYVRARWRGCGVASRMLDLAVRLARDRGAACLEGYPVVPKGRRPMPAAFAWTGVPELFTGRGFRALPRPGTSRPIYIKRFRRRRSG